MTRVRNVTRAAFDALYERLDVHLSSPALTRLGYLSLRHPEDHEFWIVYLENPLPMDLGGEAPPPWWVADETVPC